MPLGAMPGMTYEENEAYLSPGESILLHSEWVAVIRPQSTAGLFAFFHVLPANSEKTKSRRADSNR